VGVRLCGVLGGCKCVCVCMCVCVSLPFTSLVVEVRFALADLLPSFPLLQQQERGCEALVRKQQKTDKALVFICLKKAEEEIHEKREIVGRRDVRYSAHAHERTRIRR